MDKATHYVHKGLFFKNEIRGIDPYKIYDTDSVFQLREKSESRKTVKLSTLEKISGCEVHLPRSQIIRN